VSRTSPASRPITVEEGAAFACQEVDNLRRAEADSNDHDAALARENIATLRVGGSRADAARIWRDDYANSFSEDYWREFFKGARAALAEMEHE
jgi:hypothetical protein